MHLSLWDCNCQGCRKNKKTNLFTLPSFNIIPSSSYFSIHWIGSVLLRVTAHTEPLDLTFEQCSHETLQWSPLLCCLIISDITVGCNYIWWVCVDVSTALTSASSVILDASGFNSTSCTALPMQSVYEARRSCESFLSDKPGKDDSCPDTGN